MKLWKSSGFYNINYTLFKENEYTDLCKVQARSQSGRLRSKVGIRREGLKLK